MSRRLRRDVNCRGRVLALGDRTLVMGILNLTPDSFSDGGSYGDCADAVSRAKQMVLEGADIIDVGGESTRPGAEAVPEAEELRRVVPVIEALVHELEVPVSIDTYKPAVAREALSRGAHLVNDVTGLQADPCMAPVCAAFGAPVVAMHSRRATDRLDIMREIANFLLASVQVGVAAGIPQGAIIVDPGIGFAKDFSDNLAIMASLDRLRDLGQPILLGASRKSFIGLILDLPASDRVEGTLATSVMGAVMGVDIVRVHDVAATVRALKVADRIINTRSELEAAARGEC